MSAEELLAKAFETFEAFIRASSTASITHVTYQFGRAYEREVWVAQEAERVASKAHIEAITDLAHALVADTEAAR